MYNEFDDERKTSDHEGTNQTANDQTYNASGNTQNQENTGENFVQPSQTGGQADQSGIYRMKFDHSSAGEKQTGAGTGNYNNNYQSGGSNYQNSTGYSYGSNYNSQGSYYQNANGYNNYYQNTSSPKSGRRPKKKGGFGRQMAKVVCCGLAFGLVAGGTMWGVNTLGNAVTGSGNSQTQTASDGFTLDVVRTSSTEVETIEGTNVSDIVEEAKPSIVAVTTVVQTTTQDIFGRTYSQEGAGAGSGIIFSEEDNTMYIITNYHVIEDSTEVNVTFSDDTTASAVVRGYDQDADIAVLSVDMSQLSDDTKNTVKIAVMGDSDTIKEGDGAIAIGNALGYGQSVTTGTISAVNRQVQMTDGTQTMIQTDAAINEGNSGGALLNTNGEVIGINSAKLYGETIEGMGYAIPINSAIETVNNIMSGNVKTDENTASLGILGGTISEAYTQTYGWPAGVYVSAVVENSAAQRAGIQSGYIITGFNGETITTMEQLQGLLESCSPGDEATITVMVPDDSGQYTQEMTLTTLLGSAAETAANNYIQE